MQLLIIYYRGLCRELTKTLRSSSQFGLEGMDSVIQNSVLDVQLSMEEGLASVLKARGKPAVLLCDRGPMDGAA